MKFLISILFTMFFLNISLNAQILHNVSYLDKRNRCILNNYYSKNGIFYFQYAKDLNTIRSTTNKNFSSSIIPGYKFDTQTLECSPEEWLILGMDVKDFNFLLALIGVFMGFIFAFSIIYLFIIVGGKR